MTQENHLPIPAHPVDRDTPFYTIGQVAAVLSLQPATLRRFDEESVVSPGRSRGGQRRYSARELELLREVISLTNEGLTLAAVRHVLELRRRVEELEQELSHIKGQRDEAGERPRQLLVEEAADVGGRDSA
ncbi:MerR family transcriptional regulator [Tessaracoccus sp. Z1128]